MNATTSLEHRLRQISILVASVDTAAARQILMSLPTEIAKRVRAMAADMGPIPPEERRALLAEFQKSQTQLKPDGLAADPVRRQQETSAKVFAEMGSPGVPPSPLESSPSTNAPSWTRLGVETLVRLVKNERPTVIAVVLQQLPAAQAAAVLQRLPRAVTKESLQIMGSIQDIDDEAMQAIDEHLSERLRNYHHKIENELEQARRVNELLSAAPMELKQQWASWLKPDVYLEEHSTDSVKPLAATTSALNTLDRFYQSTTITAADSVWPVSNQLNSESQETTGRTVSPADSPAATASTLSATRRPLQQKTSPTALNSKTAGAAMPSSISHAPASANTPSPQSAITDGQSQSTTSSTSEQADDQRPMTIPFPGSKGASISVAERKLLLKRMDQMLSLAPEPLAQLLCTLDSQTILLALAGASTSFMRRFSNMLEPDDARVLNERIKSIGQVSLREIDQAQLRMVAAYDDFVPRATESAQAMPTRRVA